MAPRLSRPILGICLVGVLLLVGCANDQSSGRVGEPIGAGDYQLTITNVENPANPPDRFTNPRPGNRLVKVDFSVNNRGGLHLPLWASYFSLRDSGGVDNPARTDISGEQYLRQRTVPPGGSAQSTLYFEMAANQRPERLVFDPEIIGWRTQVSVQLSG